MPASIISVLQHLHQPHTVSSKQLNCTDGLLEDWYAGCVTMSVAVRRFRPYTTICV